MLLSLYYSLEPAVINVRSYLDSHVRSKHGCQMHGGLGTSDLVLRQFSDFRKPYIRFSFIISPS